MKPGIYLLALMLILLIRTSFAQPELQQANEALQAGDYPQAIRIYEAIITDLDQPSSELLYNLALSYLQLNDNAQAMLYFLRARQIAPNDTDIQANIARIRARLGVSENIPSDLFSQWINLLRNITSADALLTIGWLLWICWWVLLALKFLKHLKYNRSLLAVTGIVLLLILAAWASDRIYEIQRPETVVMVNTSARSGPAEDYLELFIAQAGLEVRLIEENEDWLRTVTIDGRSAWIKASDVVLVNQ